MRMTQEELAGQLGVSRTTVTSWETGRQYPQRYAGAIESLLEITIPEQEAVS
jgi:DNA-binding XRE family transcriptional regulator